MYNLADLTAKMPCLYVLLSLAIVLTVQNSEEISQTFNQNKCWATLDNCIRESDEPDDGFSMNKCRLR